MEKKNSEQLILLTACVRGPSHRSEIQRPEGFCRNRGFHFRGRPSGDRGGIAVEWERPEMLLALVVFASFNISFPRFPHYAPSGL